MRVVTLHHHATEACGTELVTHFSRPLGREALVRGRDYDGRGLNHCTGDLTQLLEDSLLELEEGFDEPIERPAPSPDFSDLLCFRRCNTRGLA